ncbi:MAG: peptide ABC transporter substrate-binding protein [Anaerolineae bacterium]|nr:peptide ABC transporter substrate-binding protein [Anaerolineae bacterium]
MQPNIRWQMLLAVVCLGLVFALLSFQVQSEGLCTARVPAAGGSMAEGVVGIPRFLNPLLSDPNPVDRQLTSLIFDGLLYYDDSGRLAPALARDWRVSEDGLTVTFSLREDVTWHDGEPFTADDVVFTYSLLQNEAFPAAPALRALWQSVTISRDGPATVSFTLPEPYSPFLDATTRGILPAHLLGAVPPAQIADHAINRQPVGTGPFMVPAGENWERTGRLRLIPNPALWSQGTQLDSLTFRFFPNFDAVIDAYQSGELHAIGDVPSPRVPEVLALEQTRLYTSPSPRYTELLFNLEGHAAIRVVEVRQALAYGLNRDALIDQAIAGQGLPLEGPYIPTSWAYNPAALSAYAYNPISATIALDDAGWLASEAGGTRQREGDAGAETLSLRLLLPDEARMRAIGANLATQWGEIGVALQLVPLAADAYREALASGDFDLALVEIVAETDPDLYSFWSQEALVRGQNYGRWNSRRASEALEHARQLWDEDERQVYYDAFLGLYSRALPALTLYQHVENYAVSEAVNGLEIGRIDQPRDRYETLPAWFLLYRDVSVRCPETPVT